MMIQCEEGTSTSDFPLSANTTSDFVEPDAEVSKDKSGDEDAPSKTSAEFTSALHDVKSFIEIASTKQMNKWFRGCKWSPDGSCLLSNNGDNTMRIYDLPQPLYTQTAWNKEESGLIPPLAESVSLRCGGMVYDFDWFPSMSSWDPPSCCFVCTSSSAPIHLRDAFTGQLRASYLGYDKADDVVGATSVTFDPTGARIFGGYKNEVKIFDLQCPGRKYTSLDLKAIADQRGIVSCIAINPDFSSIFAVGSYAHTLGIYSDEGDLISLLDAHNSGLTHLLFSKDGIKLFSGTRADDEILCWDLRNTSNPYFVLKRAVNTCQRIYFDITPDSKFLTTGSTTGLVSTWDLSSENAGDSPAPTLDPVNSFQAEKDCINGFSYNPRYPLAATASGQIHYPEFSSDDESDFCFKPDSARAKSHFKIKLWWTGPCQSL